VCAKNHPDRLSRLATIHQRYRRTDGRTDFLWHRPRPNGRPKTSHVHFLHVHVPTFLHTGIEYIHEKSASLEKCIKVDMARFSTR